MIKKLKIFAIAMLATGATVANVNAITNVLQSVSVALTVYEQKAPGVLQPGASFNTKAMLAAVTNALGTNGVFDKKATLDILTTSIVTQTGTTNVITNGVVSVTTNLTLSSTNFVLSGTNGVGTNVTIGLTNGNLVTITATNGSNNVILTQAGALGPTITTNATNVVVLDANQTVIIGTNPAVPLETNLTWGATPESVDSAWVTIITNGTILTNVQIATNTVTFTTNSVTVGTNTTTFPTNAIVEITNSTSTNVVYTNGTAPGFGVTNTFTDSLTTTFTVQSTNGVTNVLVTTSTTDLTTNTVTITNVVPVFTTNASSELIVADGTNNTVVPTNIVDITELGTNDIVVNNARTGLETGDYSVKRLLLINTNTSPVTLKLQGLVHQTVQVVVVDKNNKPSVTNEAWTDVSGYGTNDGTPIVVAGTITIGTPTLQKVK